jgi:hypothetical protein
MDMMKNILKILILVTIRQTLKILIIVMNIYQIMEMEILIMKMENMKMKKIF